MFFNRNCLFFLAIESDLVGWEAIFEVIEDSSIKSTPVLIIEVTSKWSYFGMIKWIFVAFVSFYTKSSYEMVMTINIEAICSMAKLGRNPPWNWTTNLWVIISMVIFIWLVDSKRVHVFSFQSLRVSTGGFLLKNLFWRVFTWNHELAWELVI